MLRAFIAAHRDDILAKARARVASRNAPAATETELTHGLPIFLDQLGEALRKATAKERVDHAEIDASAGKHGHDLFLQGLTVAQVVHDYGDLCQVITSLAVDNDADIPSRDFRTLNLCLDDAIAGAVTEHALRRERAIVDAGTERLGVFGHEMRNLISTAMMSFAGIKKGKVAPGGGTSAIHERSLLRLHSLIDSSLADVRLDAQLLNVEHIPVCEILEEVEIGASLLAQTRGLQLAVTTVEPTVIVDGDRQILAAALANLLQNAFKFTRPGSTVRLRASTTATRVLIDVEDECGGLPPGKHENLLQPFKQKDRDRTGLGLGLSICLKSVTAMSGDLHIRDMPGKGCVFTIDLPKQPPPPPSLVRRTPIPKASPGGASA